MREDGRKADELRPVTMATGYIEYPEGSVLIAMGRTRVLCNATVEEEVPRWMKFNQMTGGWITGEYALLPRSTQTRTPREIKGLGGRTQEIRRLIGRSLRAAVDLKKLGQRTITLDCDVLQADGGTRTAAITGGYVALAIALTRLIQAGAIPADTIVSPVAAISAGVVDGQALLDLAYSEDSRAESDFNIVMNARGEYIEVQGTAEGQPYSRDRLNKILDLCASGIGQLLQAQQHALAEVSHLA